MDLIKINDNKLKIMLTPVDMQSYDLRASELDCTNIETRQAFRSIMDEARSRTGFDAKGNQIYVQVYPSREGGCEMFVTKLGVVCALEDKKEPPSLSSSIGTTTASATRPDTAEATERGRTIAFVFDTLNDLLRVCRRLYTRPYAGHSAAYHGEEGGYYLLLSDRKQNRRYTFYERAVLSLISEYGRQQNADVVRLYIREHARPICECRAIERLSVL